jgi:hypothetical protein
MNLRSVLRAALLAFLVLPLTTKAEDGSKGGGAFLKSLVIPGWGQYSLDHKNYALTFLGTEVTLIGGMLVLESYGASTRDDYQAMAAAYAGVQGGHNHDFYVDVGNWMTVDQFNEQRLRDRSFDRLYTSSADRWSWDSDEHRASMERMRLKSDRAFNSVFYLVGGLVFNHLAAAVHAGRLAVLQQKSHASVWSPQGWAVNVRPLTKSKGVRFSFTHTF